MQAQSSATNKDNESTTPWFLIELLNSELISSILPNSPNNQNNSKSALNLQTTWFSFLEKKIHN